MPFPATSLPSSLPPPQPGARVFGGSQTTWLELVRGARLFQRKGRRVETQGAVR